MFMWWKTKIGSHLIEYVMSGWWNHFWQFHYHDYIKPNLECGGLTKQDVVKKLVCFGANGV
jgi:hypothetical protein